MDLHLMTRVFVFTVFHFGSSQCGSVYRTGVVMFDCTVYCMCPCDQNEGAELISLTTLTKVYNPYQNRRRGKGMSCS